jgi:hypothetical protein
MNAKGGFGTCVVTVAYCEERANTTPRPFLATLK